jgi:hypothetical protein
MLSKAQEGIADAGVAAKALAEQAKRLTDAITSGTLPEVTAAVADLHVLLASFTSQVPMMATEGKETMDAAQATLAQSQSCMERFTGAFESTMQQLREATRAVWRFDVNGSYDRTTGQTKVTGKVWRELQGGSK